MSSSAPQLPPFESVLKSREVEDPVNLWVHRPLAYGLVALLYRSPVTPNQITLLSLLVGLGAGACILAGSPALMLWGGALLWTSAILDGADGILARAKHSFSELGRALDGTADMLVAVATVLPAVYHLWVKHHDPLILAVAPVAIGTTVLHIYLYDFYKESYLQMTNPAWSGRPERVADAGARFARVKAEGGTLPAVVASKLYFDLVRAQARVVALTNPWGTREGLQFQVTPATVAAYRRNNRAAIQTWALISLAPHSYLMSIAAMFDRVDVYLWLRLFAANAVFMVLLFWQRACSRRTRAELERMGLGPATAAA
jgi:phosphatidylglycerophosphate synthase